MAIIKSLASNTVFAFLVCCAILLGSLGCNDSVSSQATTENEGQENSPSSQHQGDSITSDSGNMAKIDEALANLSEDDRQEAMKQHICPVSEQLLGTMGAPQKIDVQGTSVWICCDSCKEKLLSEPDKYTAKLNK